MSHQPQTIELRPGPLSNRGGELMLVAMARELGGDFRLAVEPWIGPYQRRASLELYQKVGFRHRYSWAGRAAGFVPRRLRDAFGIVTEADIAAVLDASGFAYGDQHGPDRVRRAARHIRRWKAQRKKVVLMPQALGPFKEPAVARHARALLEAADLVYARDAESEGHARRLLPGAGHIRRAPDFTIPLRAEPGAGFDGGGPYACVVPNWRMRKSTPSHVSEQYLSFLGRCVASLQARGLRVVIVVHEGGGDLDIARELAALVGQDLPIADGPDPLRLKGVLAGARLVVGSRYHALVGALSSGVPAIGTGWSHKYEALYADFEAPELLLSPGLPEADLDALIARLSDDHQRDELRQRLLHRTQQLTERVDAMWREVRTTLAG